MTHSAEPRRVVLVTHPSREGAAEVAQTFARLLADEGVTSVVPKEQAHVFDQGLIEARDDASLMAGAELVVVLGGDGTILWGAELARDEDVPLLGLNLGHVGFLAEAEENELSEVADAVVGQKYRVEERLALDVALVSQGEVTARTWALNEASIEKGSGSRVVDLMLSIDEHPLSRWSTDGIVCATPTGSTAYAWSAGGPVVWPDIEAIMVVPNSAHALFARPLVVSPDSTIRVELMPGRHRGDLWCDGRRRFDLLGGDSVVIRRSHQPVLLARLHAAAFVERLVAKFHLPVDGWRRAPGNVE